MKKKWWIIALAVATIFLLAWLICRNEISKKKALKDPEMTQEEFVMTLMPSTVMVTAGESHASGVIIDINDERIAIVTAGHLMQGYDQGIITFYTGNAGFGNVRFISENPDICILEFERKYLDEGLVKELSSSAYDLKHYEDLAVDDMVYLVGSAISAGSNATVGKVAAKDFYVDDFDDRMLYLYTDVMAGMSGCGVYDGSGYLVGILAGGNDSGEAVCVSLPEILEHGGF